VLKGNSPSFLVVALRYIGDVLVTTPLALSIKKAIPGARVEYLVFDGTQAVLAKNPYVDRVHVLRRGSRSLELLHLFKKFDFSFGCNPGDRTAIAAALTGRRSLALSYHRRNEWWKHLVLDQCCPYDDNLHAVQLMLSLLDPLKIPKIPAVTMGFDSEDRNFAKTRLPEKRYVLLHPYSRGTYKYWPANHWGKLAGTILRQTACVPVFTVTGDPQDRQLLDAILSCAPAGCRTFTDPFSLSQLAAAIEGSVAYIGIDTVVTHIAAAVGARTFALFGPSYTRYWAPWPNGCTAASPFAANRGVQCLGGVTVIQKGWPCVPCNAEACLISERGRTECLEELHAEEVFGIICSCLNEGEL